MTALLMGEEYQYRIPCPLVFLILPLSILFAVFPGVFMLRLGIV